jgi:hypothetical protein
MARSKTRHLPAAAPVALLLIAGCTSVRGTGEVFPPVDELSQADVQRTIQAHQAGLRACAGTERRLAPDSRSKALVQFHILQSGEARDVDVRGDASPDFKSCIREVFAAMRFRAHRSDPELVIWPMKY